ncbi:VanZ family protein [Cytobacillus sp. Sa5YUA1]|uniref:VanZ family protein n=1 Tax=Cytobacillus stercorigallinarum TaxID=2762240 RepID=A0ABR8QP26_9BACI|nr:VanZ family protein [Cytobacillus stercorigallinarum]MBD7937292.1 VanZ family protein [Cytobacillus stercorigallinarum]
MDKEIESYIKQIVNTIDCNHVEKQEIIDEMTDHILLLKQEHMLNGKSEKEAVQLALADFGNQKSIAHGYNQSIFPFYRLFKVSSWLLFSLFALVVSWKLIFGRLLERVMNYANGYGYNFYFFSREEQMSFFNFNFSEWGMNLNIIPFKTTINYLLNADLFNLDIIITNTIGNILIFLPLGLLLPVLFKQCRLFSVVTITAITASFSIELLQFFLQVGQFDIDDIILNTMGAMIGYLMYKTILNVNLFIRKANLKLNKG